MTCEFGGKSYSEGSLICSNGRELRCSGGAWQETGYSCAGATDEKYYKIATDGLSVFENEDEIKPRSSEVEAASCVRLVQHSNMNEVKFYNNCNGCMIVTMSWSNNQVDHVRVGPYQFAVSPRRSSYGEIVGDRPC